MQLFDWTPARVELVKSLVKQYGKNIPAKEFDSLKVVIGANRKQINRRIARILNEKPTVDKPEKEESGTPRERLLERQLLEAKADVRRMAVERTTSLQAENLMDIVRDEIKLRLEPLNPVPTKILSSRSTGMCEEDLVMHLSDEHADQVVLPHRVNGLENYNLSVALARAEKYVDTLLSYTQKTLSNYKFNTLWILAYGDHVNGEIHNGTDNSTLRNQFGNALSVGQMHAMMFRDLAPYFKDIKVIYIPGNHGRTSQKKDYVTGALKNWDYLVAEVAKMACADIENLEFLVPDAYCINVDIRGHIFNVSHGDDVKSFSGLPWYGIERRNRRLQAIHSAAGQQIHYKVMGHFHQAGTMQDPVGETILNGSWKATDEYCYNQLGGYCKPYQWIHGVHEDFGVTWRLSVHLKHAEDVNGPKRYKLKFASEYMQRQADAVMGAE